jgi:hypothetical protein
MRRLVLCTVAMAILTVGVWAHAQAQGTQAPVPSTGSPAPTDSGKKAPEDKSGKHHHHKHHHKKQTQPTQ